MNTKKQMNMKSVVIGIFVLLLPACLLATDVISGKVITVIDGNTLEVYTGENETYKILLFGIDSPELEQDYGDKAKRFLEKLILDKNIEVQVQGKDRLGNRLGIILIDGEDMREKLLEAGLAWTSERNPIESFEAIKEKSREKRKGLWKETEPTPPWIFRRQQTLLQYKKS
jgi:endonuclease YncB( thermonuclease family)